MYIYVYVSQVLGMNKLTKAFIATADDPAAQPPRITLNSILRQLNVTVVRAHTGRISFAFALYA